MKRFLVLAIPLMLLFVLAGAVRAERAVLVAGGGEKGDGALAVEAKLITPFGYVRDADGSAYLVEYASRVVKIDPKGILTTLAGNGEKGDAGDGGPGLKAKVNQPHSLVLGADGMLFIADTINNRVRKIDPKSGVISAFAGTGEKGASGDGGPAKDAKFNGIYCIAADPKGGRLILTDLENKKIRAVGLKTGIVTTLAGNGMKGIPADGAEATKAPLVDPRAAAMDLAGNLYILERSGNALRVVDPAGKIRTVVGTGKSGSTGDGGAALQATMNGPKHLCIDGEGNVIIADTENHLIRKYTPKDGKIVRVAGTGKKGTGGLNGPALEVELNKPHGVYIDSTGILYISDSENGRVLKIEK